MNNVYLTGSNDGCKFFAQLGSARSSNGSKLDSIVESPLEGSNEIEVVEGAVALPAISESPSHLISHEDSPPPPAILMDRGDSASIDAPQRLNRERRKKRNERTISIEPQPESDDDAIRIHSLSSNATILVPETHKGPRNVRDSISKYENNFIRPRTALGNGRRINPTVSNGPSEDRRVQTAAAVQTSTSNFGHIRPVPNPRSARPINVVASVIDDEYESDYPASSRADAPGAVHPWGQNNHPLDALARYNNNLMDPFMRSRRSSRLGGGGIYSSMSRPVTASSEVVNVAYTESENETFKALRKLFQIQTEVGMGEEEGSYNEWREGMEDPGDESRAIKEVVESLYEAQIELTKDNEKVYNYKVLLGRIVELLDEFALVPTPPGFNVKCRVTRRRVGIDGKLFPQFYLHLQRKNEPDVLLMTAKRSKSLFTKSYVICTDPSDISKKSEHCVGVLQANFKRSALYLYTQNLNEEEDASKGNDTQIMTVSFEHSEDLGIKGPRCIRVAMPKMKSDYLRTLPDEKLKIGNDNHIQLKNLEPVWNANSNSYMLNFRERVEIASVKNFLLVHPDLNEHAILLFGKLGRDDFVLDFSYPFCPLQAFALAIASFDVKWGLE